VRINAKGENNIRFDCKTMNTVEPLV